MMMCPEEAPRLLCAIGSAGPRWWTFSGGFDLFLFEECLVAARVTASEAWRGYKQLEGVTKAALVERMRLDAKGERPIAELVGAHASNRSIPTTAVREATLRRRWIISRLTLTLSDGETLSWAWGPPNRPFEDVYAAFRRVLGSRLAL